MLDSACNTYRSLETTFSLNRGKDLINMLWGNVIIPLADERRVQLDHFRNMQELLEHIKEEPIPKMDQ